MTDFPPSYAFDRDWGHTPDYAIIVLIPRKWWNPYHWWWNPYHWWLIWGFKRDFQIIGFIRKEKPHAD